MNDERNNLNNVRVMIQRERNITRAKFLEVMELSSSTLYDMEQEGKRPAMYIYKRMANRFGFPLEMLCNYEEA